MYLSVGSTGLGEAPPGDAEQEVVSPGTASPVPGLKTQLGNSESGRTRVGMAFADPSPLSPQNRCRWGEVGARSIGRNAGANRGSSFFGEGWDGAFRCLWSRPLAQVGPKRTSFGDWGHWRSPAAPYWQLRCVTVATSRRCR